ncbi:uncharacterized protein [Ptychodera flava]|uniref:uncharacterized protein n=1 Tax=Ptychodera flava TaxID=63121 RepID=UPI003969E3EB
MEESAGALFLYDEWKADQCGLTGFHRIVIQEFCSRKAVMGQNLKAYSTVLSLEIKKDQDDDAKRCGVTLIPAKLKERADPDDEIPELKWLLNHEIYYPDLKELKKIKYVVGYAPKTGSAAADIRARLFPGAKLVLINHVIPEEECLLMEKYGQEKLEEKMLKMAGEADMLFSIGPRIHEHFENAYRADQGDKRLSDILHEEILPKPIGEFFKRDLQICKDISTYSILTCWNFETSAIEGCETIAGSIKKAADMRKESQLSRPQSEWKLGVPQNIDQNHKKAIVQKLGDRVDVKLYHKRSAGTLLTYLQQSHLYLPTPYYMDYSFYGLEAVAIGLPTVLKENSHLGDFITKHCPSHADLCAIDWIEEELSKKILANIAKPSISFKRAKELKHVFEGTCSNGAMFAALTEAALRRKQSLTDNPGRDDEGARNMPEDDKLQVHVGLDENTFNERLKELGEEVKSLKEDIRKLRAKWRDSNQAFKHRVAELVDTAEDSLQEVKKVCKEKLGDDMDPKRLTAESLGILLELLTLYALYKLKQTCRSGSLAKAFEPLLITDEMREIAAEVGLKLQLKATYNLEKFKEVERFFFERDGRGIEPVYDAIIEEESVEEILLNHDDVEGGNIETAEVTASIDKTTQTDLHAEGAAIQSAEFKVTKHVTMMERVAETDNVLISTNGEEGSESARWKDSDERSAMKEQPSIASKPEKGDWSVRFTDGYSQKTGRIFKQPRGMVFHGNRLVVCDPENNIVRILNEDYRCDKVLGSFDGQFARPFKPWDVAVSDESYYFMNDRGNFQIVVCDEDNKILTLIDLTWDIEAHGITICLGFLVVTDVRGHRLLKYTKGGKYVSDINNKELCGLSQFNRPYSVAVNSNGEIGVSDHWNHCIKRFDDELKFRDEYGELGTGDGQLWYPFGMDIDNNNDVYVCDGGNHRIVKCKSDGSWSGDLFCDVWQLRNPRYIAVQKDRIAVAELDNSNIKIFYK